MNKNENPELYSALKKPSKCPKCGCRRVVKIIYGEPTHEALLKYHEGKVALGGCCIVVGGPVWQCLDCETGICKKERPNPVTPIDEDLPF